jgi:hypothetical protein
LDSPGPVGRILYVLLQIYMFVLIARIIMDFVVSFT